MSLAIPRFSWLGLCLGLTAYLAIASARAEVDIYSVAGVPVDVTAGTVIEARRDAEVAGQREALRLLLRKLTTSEHFGRLPETGSIEIGPLVRSFSVEKEQFSANRYIAEVTASFRGDAVQRLLQGRGVPIILEPSAPLLVVPVRERDGQLRIAARSDALATAWNTGHNRNTVLDVRLPLGDLLDARQVPLSVNSEAIANGLSAMAARYGTGHAVMVIASGDTPNEAQEALSGGQISVRLGGQFEWPYGFSSFALSADDEAVWMKSVAESLQRLERDWKRDRLVRFDNVETLTVSAPLADLGSWTKIARALNSLPEVQASQIQRFNQRQAIIRLRFVGGLPQLQRSLQGKGLQLSDNIGQWQLLSASRANGLAN